MKLKNLLLLLALIMLSGCAFEVKHYDAVADSELFDLNFKLNATLLKMKGSIGSYTCDYSFYTEDYNYLHAKIDVLKQRTLLTSNKDSVNFAQLVLLDKSISDLERLHKTTCLDTVHLKDVKNDLDHQFNSIIKLELESRKLN
jgi:hypothetical protein